jgi:hypothetical protein
MWHDFVTVLAPPNTPLWLRRTPEDTIPMIGQWSGQDAFALVTPDNWVIPWCFVTRWRLLTAPAPAWPAPTPSRGAYRDVYANPPAASQRCWVRRWPEDTSAFQALWTLADEPFFLLDTGWQLPWYLAWKWKPMA